MIVFDHVTKCYRPGEPALADVTFHVERGEFVLVTGPSGAGKTTLLRLVTREVTATEGRVVVDGVELGRLGRGRVQALRRRMGIVFQDFRLLPRYTVEENVALVLRALGWPPGRRRERVARVLEWVGLTHKAEEWPLALSGGEQQRVAIARALAPEPRLLLADEPTGNLDPDRSREILDLLRQAHARGTTVLLATHDEALIEASGGRRLHLVDGRLAP